MRDPVSCFPIVDLLTRLFVIALTSGRGGILLWLVRYLASYMTNKLEAFFRLESLNEWYSQLFGLQMRMMLEYRSHNNRRYKRFLPKSFWFPNSSWSVVSLLSRFVPFTFVVLILRMAFPETPCVLYHLVIPQNERTLPTPVVSN